MLYGVSGVWVWLVVWSSDLSVYWVGNAFLASVAVPSVPSKNLNETKGAIPLL